MSSSYSSKNPASSLELTVFWLRKASLVSGPAPLHAEWCRAAANSMRTVIRSCRSHERSRRSLLRRAEPTSRSAMSKPTIKVLDMWLTTKGIHTGQDACCCGCCGCVLLLYIVKQDLGHFDNLHGIRKKSGEELHDAIQNLHHRSEIGRLLHGALLIPVFCPRGSPRQGGRDPWEEVVPDHGRDVEHEPIPRSWPCSVPLGRRGG